MNRPTRVPASIVVRMNTASNMIAKWYQSARPGPVKTLPRMPAMPTARLGAPPVRDSRVVSPICTASASSWPGVTTKPHCAIAAAAVSELAPRVAGPTFMAK
jgi:hypothetical protein